MIKSSVLQSHSPMAAPRSFLHPKATCSVGSEVYDCELNLEGDLVAASVSDGFVSVFETQKGTLVYKIPHCIFQQTLPVISVKFCPVILNDLQNVLLLAYSTGYVDMVHVPTNTSLVTFCEPRNTLATAFAFDASTFATAGSDCKLMVYDTKTGDRKITLEASSSFSKMDGHMNRVFSLHYLPNDPNIILSGGWDNTVQFWDIRQEQSIRKISGPHICGDALDIEPNTLNIATGSWRYDTPLEIWDYRTGNLLSNINCISHTKLYATCWAGEKHVLVGGSQKHCALAIDITTDKVVGEIRDMSHGVYGVAHNKHTKMSAIASGDNVYLCQSLLSENKVASPYVVEDGD